MNYFPQIHLIDTIEFKHEIEYRGHFERIRSERSKKVNKVNERGLFPYYISGPSRFSENILSTLERYQILTDLNSEAYHSNCFICALGQTKIIPENIINCIKTHITSSHIKTKDIGFLGKEFELSFIPMKLRLNLSTYT